MKKKFIIFSVIAIFLSSSIAVYTNYAATNAVNAMVYSWGSYGETVKQIQTRLKDWGYYKGSIDGSYGYQTWEAVKFFQQKNGLVADGIVGAKTLAALGMPTGSSNSGASREKDINLLACAIYGEGRGEPYTGQVAIGAVIINRTNHPSFPDTIAGVIYQPGAFDVVRDGQINLTPNDTAIKAAKDALNSWDPTNGAIYYWNPKTATNKWIWSIPITCQIGNHVFGKK